MGQDPAVVGAGREARARAGVDGISATCTCTPTPRSVAKAADCVESLVRERERRVRADETTAAGAQEPLVLGEPAFAPSAPLRSVTS